MSFDIDRFKKGSPALPVIPNRKEENALTVMILRAINQAPFFAQIGMSQCPILFTRDVPIAATDEFNVFISPELFAHYQDMDEWVFVYVHEQLHVVGHDCSTMHMYDALGSVMGSDGKSRPFHWEVGNWALDFRNNFAIVASNIGKRPEDCLWDPEITNGTEDFAEIYCRTYDKYVKKGKGSGGKDGKGSGLPQGNGVGGPGGTTMRGFDIVLRPGSASNKEPSEGREQEMTIAIAQAAQAAQLAGKLPGMVQRLIAGATVKPIAWHQRLKRQVARRKHGSGWDFRASDRRLIQRGISVPRRAQKQTGVVVIGTDVSGSIEDTDVAEFYAHITDIISSCHPKEIHLMWFDVEVRRHDVVHDLGSLAAIKQLAVPGGGGTRFGPVFEAIAKRGIKPTVCIMLTDGYGDKPKEPSFPVLWACTTAKTQAFGDHVRIR
jgi:predicted metal-dependent peptidase